MLEKARRWIKRLESFADRPWYFPFVGFLSGLDLFILIVPLDAILISSVMLQPRKWVGAFIWAALGSAIAAAVLAGLIHWDADLVMNQWFPSAFQSAAWQSMDAFVDKYGGIAVFLIALSPLVQFPSVAIAALAGMPIAEIFIFVLLGRAGKSALICWGASHAPKLLLKIPFIRRELEAIDAPVEKYLSSGLFIICLHKLPRFHYVLRHSC